MAVVDSRQAFQKYLNGPIHNGRVTTSDDAMWDYFSTPISKGQPKKPSGWAGVVGNVLDFAPVKYGLIKPLEVLDTGRRAVISGVRELVDELDSDPNTNASWSEFADQATDTSFGFGTAFPMSGWVGRVTGFVGDVALDPLTYVTFGANQAGKAGGMTGRAASTASRRGRLALSGRVAEVLGDAAKAKRAARWGRAGLSASDLNKLGYSRAGLYFMGKRIGGTTKIGEFMESAIAGTRVWSGDHLFKRAREVFDIEDAQAARRALLRGEVSDENAIDFLHLVNSRNRERAAAAHGERGVQSMTREHFSGDPKDALAGVRGTLYREVEDVTTTTAGVAAGGAAPSAEVQRVRNWFQRIRVMLRDADPEFAASGKSSFGDVGENYLPHMVSDDGYRFMADGGQQGSDVRDLLYNPLENRNAFKSRMEEGDVFFGTTLTQADVDGGIERLNQIARNGGFEGDFFETDILTIMRKYERQVGDQFGVLARRKYLIEKGVAKRLESKLVGDPDALKAWRKLRDATVKQRKDARSVGKAAQDKARKRVEKVLRDEAARHQRDLDRLGQDLAAAQAREAVASADAAAATVARDAADAAEVAAKDAVTDADAAVARATTLSDDATQAVKDARAAAKVADAEARAADREAASAAEAAAALRDRRAAAAEIAVGLQNLVDQMKAAPKLAVLHDGEPSAVVRAVDSMTDRVIEEVQVVADKAKLAAADGNLTSESLVELADAHEEVAALVERAARVEEVLTDVGNVVEVQHGRILDGTHPGLDRKYGGKEPTVAQVADDPWVRALRGGTAGSKRKAPITKAALQEMTPARAREIVLGMAAGDSSVSAMDELTAVLRLAMDGGVTPEDMAGKSSWWRAVFADQVQQSESVEARGLAVGSVDTVDASVVDVGKSKATRQLEQTPDQDRVGMSEGFLGSENSVFAQVRKAEAVRRGVHNASGEARRVHAQTTVALAAESQVDDLVRLASASDAFDSVMDNLRVAAASGDASINVQTVIAEVSAAGDDAADVVRAIVDRHARTLRQSGDERVADLPLVSDVTEAIRTGSIPGLMSVDELQAAMVAVRNSATGGKITVRAADGTLVDTPFAGLWDGVGGDVRGLRDRLVIGDDGRLSLSESLDSGAWADRNVALGDRVDALTVAKQAMGQRGSLSAEDVAAIRQALDDVPEAAHDNIITALNEYRRQLRAASSTGVAPDRELASTTDMVRRLVEQKLAAARDDLAQLNATRGAAVGTAGPQTFDSYVTNLVRRSGELLDNASEAAIRNGMSDDTWTTLMDKWREAVVSWRAHEEATTRLRLAARTWGGVGLPQESLSDVMNAVRREFSTAARRGADAAAQRVSDIDHLADLAEEVFGRLAITATEGERRAATHSVLSSLEAAMDRTGRHLGAELDRSRKLRSLFHDAFGHDPGTAPRDTHGLRKQLAVLRSKMKTGDPLTPTEQDLLERFPSGEWAEAARSEGPTAARSELEEAFREATGYTGKSVDRAKLGAWVKGVSDEHVGSVSIFGKVDGEYAISSPEKVTAWLRKRRSDAVKAEESASHQAKRIGAGYQSALGDVDVDSFVGDAIDQAKEEVAGELRLAADAAAAAREVVEAAPPTVADPEAVAAARSALEVEMEKMAEMESTHLLLTHEAELRVSLAEGLAQLDWPKGKSVKIADGVSLTQKKFDAMWAKGYLDEGEDLFGDLWEQMRDMGPDQFWARFDGIPKTTPPNHRSAQVVNLRNTSTADYYMDEAFGATLDEQAEAVLQARQRLSVAEAGPAEVLADVEDSAVSAADALAPPPPAKSADPSDVKNWLADQVVTADGGRGQVGDRVRFTGYGDGVTREHLRSDGVIVRFNKNGNPVVKLDGGQEVTARNGGRALGLLDESGKLRRGDVWIGDGPAPQGSLDKADLAVPAAVDVEGSTLPPLADTPEVVAAVDQNLEVAELLGVAEAMPPVEPSVAPGAAGAIQVPDVDLLAAEGRLGAHQSILATLDDKVLQAERRVQAAGPVAEAAQRRAATQRTLVTSAESAQARAATTLRNAKVTARDAAVRYTAAKNAAARAQRAFDTATARWQAAQKSLTMADLAAQAIPSIRAQRSVIQARLDDLLNNGPKGKLTDDEIVDVNAWLADTDRLLGRSVTDLEKQIRDIEATPNWAANKQVQARHAKLTSELESINEFGDLQVAAHQAWGDFLSTEKRLNQKINHIERIIKGLESGDPKFIFHGMNVVEVAEKGWTKLNHQGLPSFQAREEAAQIMNSFRRLNDYQFQSAVGKLFKSYTGFFRAYAVSSPGFVIRNTLSNIFSLISAGGNPWTMGEGLGYWRAANAAIKAGEYEKWLASLPAEIGERVRTSLDIVGAVGGGRQAEATALFNPKHQKLTDNFWIRRWRTMNEHSENSARFMLAWDSVARGHDLNSGAARVSKYLFDYQDVSRLDKSMRQIMPFWFWTSRNLPLQLMNRWANPRAYQLWNNLARNMGMGEEDPYAPDFLDQPGAIRLGKSTYLNMDLPFSRVNETINMLRDPVRFGGMLNPAIRVPVESFAKRNMAFNSPMSKQPQELIGGRLAGPIGGLLAAFGMAAPGEDGELRTSASVNSALMGLLPPLSQLERTMPASEKYKARQGNSLASFFGIPIYQVSEDQREFQRWLQEQNME